MQKNKTDVVKAVCNSAAKKLIALSLAGLVSGTVVANAQQPGNAPQPGSSQQYTIPGTFCGIPRGDFFQWGFPIPDPNEDPVAFLHKLERIFVETLLNAESSFSNQQLQRQRTLIETLNNEFRSRGTFSVDTAALQELDLPQPEQNETISSFLGRLIGAHVNLLLDFFNDATRSTDEMQLLGASANRVQLEMQRFLIALLRAAIPLPFDSDTPDVFLNRVKKCYYQTQEELLRSGQDLDRAQRLNNRISFLIELHQHALEAAERGTSLTQTEIENLAQFGVLHTIFDHSIFR